MNFSEIFTVRNIAPPKHETVSSYSPVTCDHYSTCAHEENVVILSFDARNLIVHSDAGQPGLQRYPCEDRFGE